jgi:hemerythrin superfamily protein
MTGADTQAISATDFLRQQHQSVKTMFASLDDATGAQRVELFDSLRQALAVHETAEEICIHPEARQISEAANAIVDARIAEESQAKEALAELERIGPDGADFAAKLAQFQKAALAHADAEEQQLFPLIEAHVAHDRLVELTDSLRVAEDLAPSHAHPHSPSSGVGNVLVGPFVAMVDKVRDAIAEHRK